MLNRRHLRVKVLQSLYAFFQSGNTDLGAGEKELLFGIEKIYDLYLYQLALLAELHRQEERILADNRNKHLLSAEDLNPNTRFVENQALKIIAGHEALASKCKQRKIGWDNDLDIVRKLLAHIKQQHYYFTYMTQEETGFDQDRDFVVRLVKKDIVNFELLHSFYEENSIYWIDDWELVNVMLMKNIKGMDLAKGRGLLLMDLFKEDEDRVFARELFKRTILNRYELDSIISSKAQNWDLERIALMDIIIMKMALTEILKFSEIPLKVSFNEYIELSKMYSTPKSKGFVNGVLDKLVEEFVRDNKINKHVKGLSG
ncbi:MAG: transcription antitermination factor NusB [Bacteroidales bacterium]|jgi:N utilization substance protein B|nr:transcription antitermination factor NusB [Bacteroidales bacterium]NLM93592.1 transcription antitermination factor NusB [Bacteroidales bacterium]